jgi:two-component system, sensor histidine kinase LadS
MFLFHHLEKELKFLEIKLLTFLKKLILNYNRNFFLNVPLVVVTMILPIQGIKSEPILLTKDINKYDVTSKIVMTKVDSNPVFSYEILSSILENDFISNEKNYIREEFYKKDLIVKMKLISNYNRKYFLEMKDPLLDQIDILIYSKEKLIYFKTGWLVPINQRAIKDRKHIFELPLVNLNQEYDVFLKISNEDASIFNMVIITEEILWQENRDDNLILGSYYGLISIIYIIYIIVYFGSKDIKYFQYSNFIISTLFLQLCMHGTFLSFIGEEVQLNKKLYLLSIYLFYLILFYSFWSAIKMSKFSNNIYYIIFISFPVFLLILNSNYSFSINLFRYVGIINFILLLVLIIINYKDKEILKELVIWLPITIGIFIGFLRSKDIITSNLFTVNIFEISNTIQILVLSFLAQIRMSIPRKEIFIQKEILENYYKQKEENNFKLTETEERNQIILHELKLASDIQRGLIPVPEKVYPIIKVKYHYEYLMQVGGDFFDIVNIDENSISVFIADASGHGIPAALLSTMYKMSFANAISRYSNPSAIFQDVNAQTKKVLDSHDYLTAFFMVIQSSGEVVYSSAAHRPPYIYRKSKDRGEILFAKGLFLGMSSNMNLPYEEKKDKLERGDRLLFYTDGIFDESIKDTWNPESLLYIFTKSANLNFESALDHIVLEWKKRIGEKKIKDDATFLLIEYHGKM